MDGAGTVLQMALSLVAVVVMILGLAWMTRRMQGLRVSSPQDLRVKATLAVGIKERVVLIEAQGQQFLIGVAPGNVRHLANLDSPSPCGRGLGGGVPHLDHLSTPPPAAGPTRTDIESVLAKPAALPQGEGESKPPSFSEAFKQQLQQVLKR